MLVHVPKGVELEQPLYVQSHLERWPALLAHGRDRRRGRALHGDRGVSRRRARRLSRTRTRSSSCSSIPPRRSSTSRSRISRRRPGTSAGTRPGWSATASSTGSIGGFGSKSGKVWIENDLAGPGATSRVTGAYFADGEQHLDYDTFQEHIAPNTESDFAFKGALRENASAGVARDDPRRGGRAEDERLPGEPQPAALRQGARRLDSRPRDHGERRPLHPRRDARQGRTARSSST